MGKPCAAPTTRTKSLPTCSAPSCTRKGSWWRSARWGRKPTKSPNCPACSNPSPWPGRSSPSMRCTPRRPPPVIWSRRRRPTIFLRSKTINPPSSKTSPICTWNPFPPHHTTCDKGHGRLEERRIWTSTELCGYLDFPYVAQVFVIQRIIVRLTTAERCCETVYGVTSSRPEKASPACLLAWNRNHWCIENGLHYVRDFTFDEDRCRIRKHAGARVMASLRNLAISLLRLAGAENIAAALRTCARRQQHPLRLLGLACRYATSGPPYPGGIPDARYHRTIDPPRDGYLRRSPRGVAVGISQSSSLSIFGRSPGSARSLAERALQGPLFQSGHSGKVPLCADFSFPIPGARSPSPGPSLGGSQEARNDTVAGVAAGARSPSLSRLAGQTRHGSFLTPQ